MSARPRLIGYIRVSTTEQAESGLGLEAQRHEIERHADFNGWDLTIIADEGRTGANLKRPGIRKALRAIANREADGLVIAKLDRLSRSSADSAQLFHWFSEAEARLIVLDFNGLDTGTMEGSIVAGFMALMAEWERKMIGQRTKASLAALRRSGQPISRPAVIDQPELAARVKRMRDRKLTFQAICDVLNREGVPTPRGGALWRPSSLQTVCGYVRPPKRRPRTNLPVVARRRRVAR